MVSNSTRIPYFPLISSWLSNEGSLLKLYPMGTSLIVTDSLPFLYNHTVHTTTYESYYLAVIFENDKLSFTKH